MMFVIVSAPDTLTYLSCTCPTHDVRHLSLLFADAFTLKASTVRQLSHGKNTFFYLRNFFFLSYFFLATPSLLSLAIPITNCFILLTAHLYIKIHIYKKLISMVLSLKDEERKMSNATIEVHFSSFSVKNMKCKRRPIICGTYISCSSIQVAVGLIDRFLNCVYKFAYKFAS